MNKKTKKKIQVLNQKIKKLHLQLSGARQHHDDPSEVTALEEELRKAEEQLRTLKQEG